MEQKQVVIKDMKRFKDWIDRILPKGIDIGIEYNPSISYDKNKSIVREKINKKLGSKKRSVEDVYSKIRRAVDKIIKGYSNAAFIKGRGGIGKSYQIRKKLEEEDAEYVEISGQVTEAYLYRLFYENNGKIIWFKDVSKVLKGIGSINILKSATETEGKRTLTKSSYSRVQADMPDRFECKCRFIFDYNTLYKKSMNEDFKALATRGDFIRMMVNNNDVKIVMRDIAKEDWQKKVTEFLIEEYNRDSVIRLNLRTQWKAFQTYRWAKSKGKDWKKEIREDIENVSDTRLTLYNIIGTKPIRTKELKKRLLKNKVAPTLRTADRKVNEWLYTGELYKWSEGERNYFVGINPRSRVDEND